MSAPHHEMAEMSAEVSRVARALLSAGTAVAEVRARRRLQAARDAENQAQNRPTSEQGTDPGRSTTTSQQDRSWASEANQARAAAASSTVPEPAAAAPPRAAETGTVRTAAAEPSTRRVQARADAMSATTGAAAHDKHLRAVVHTAMPAMAKQVCNDRAWPALRASLHGIAQQGGDPAAELKAVQGRRNLSGANSPAKVLQWRLAKRAEQTTPTAETTNGHASTRGSAPADRHAESVLAALAADPIGTARDYADAQQHRDTHPEAAHAWDDALRAEHIDPDQIRADAKDVPVEESGPLDDRDEEFLSTLAAMDHDIDTDRAALHSAGQPNTTQTPAPEATAAPGAFATGADAARLAGQSHPRTVAEQLVDRGNQKTPQPGRARQPGLGTHRDAERER